MSQASVLRALSRDKPDEARALILRVLKAARGNRTAAALALRESAHLPPDGTDARTRVTFAEIVKSLGMVEEIGELYAEKDAKRAVVRGKNATAARLEGAAKKMKKGVGGR